MANKWHAAHYNALAKEIREVYPVEFEEPEIEGRAIRRALEELALRLTTRFAKDNENFKPVEFLDACSPDDELYPLGTLWEDYVADERTD